MIASIHHHYRAFRQLPILDQVFSLMCSVVVAVSCLPEAGFFHLGFSFPALGALGQIPGRTPKLFAFEIFFLLSLALLNVRAIVHGRPPWQFTWLVSLSIGILAFSLARLAGENPANKLFALRNGVFAWYLALPLAIVFSGLRSHAIKVAAYLGCGFTLLLFVGSLLGKLFVPNVEIEWTPHMGIYPLLGLALLIRSPKIWLPCIFFLSLAVAFSCGTHFQRTTIIGLVVVGAWCLFQGGSLQKLARIALIVVATVIFVFLLGDVRTDSPAAPGASVGQASETPPPERKNPPAWNKSEPDRYGREKFRWSMWSDAWAEFSRRPLLGIGFEKQVVKRVYLYADTYAPNDIHWNSFGSPAGKRPELIAPIAGPHNSYLNAIARLGVVGATFALLHFLLLLRFLRARELVLASLVFSHVLYAFFNVGLEGPIRSATLLLLLGLGMILERESRRSAEALPA